MTVKLSGEETAVQQILDFLRDAEPTAASREWGRASGPYDHVGAKLADAALQSGVNYENMVRRRVVALAEAYPEAATVSGLIRAVKKQGAPRLLQMKPGAKPSTFRALVYELSSLEVETVGELKALLSARWHANALRRVKGVGPKTVAFLKLVVGLDAVAVDQHILAALQRAGVPPVTQVRLRLSSGSSPRVSGGAWPTSMR